MADKRISSWNFRRNFVSGIVTILPLAVTWWLFDFIFSQLSKFGHPILHAIAADLYSEAPGVAKLLPQRWFDDLLAAAIVVGGLYGLGWLANRVIGKKIFHLMELIVGRLPLIPTVYGSVKKLVTVLQTKPENVERVVLVNFPHSKMKAVGLVTRTMVDAHTGEKLAAVYVPTTPNPTSGYMEIVPVEELVSTNWTIDEAMNFIISGGANAPGEIPYSVRQQSNSTEET